MLARYVRLKTELVAYAQRNFTAELYQRARDLDLNPDGSTDAVIRATDAVIREQALDAFLAARRSLRGPDRVLLRSWKDGFTGLFRPEGRDGRLLELHNLVDDLRYLAVISSDDPVAWQQLGETPCLLADLVPMGSLWTFSGAQRAVDVPDPRLADGLAAQLAQSDPALFFRNPEHLARGWEAMREQHEDFVSRFGAAWVVGAPADVERQHQQWMGEKVRARSSHDAIEGLAPEMKEAARATQSALDRFELPAELMEAESAGMFSDPREGLHFFPDFARLLAAFETPELGNDPEHRAVVVGYLESDSITPAVIEAVAAVDPDRASSLLRTVLARPTFDWHRHGEALLRRHKPDFYARPTLPSTLPLPPRMVDGLLALKARDEHAVPISDSGTPRVEG